MRPADWYLAQAIDWWELGYHQVAETFFDQALLAERRRLSRFNTFRRLSHAN